jgi:hypothetical protein
MEEAEIGRIAFIIVKNYFMTNAFSSGGLTEIGKNLDEISKATGVSIDKLREFAKEVLKSLGEKDFSTASPPAPTIR